MTVLIGSARINENGQLEGGKPGDQTGKEVCTEKWYLHSKGWTVIRAKDPKTRLLLAKNMQAACDNDKIGYSYWDHCLSLTEVVKKLNYDCSRVKTPVETNCAKLVRVCALYAGINVADFYTGDEVEKFKATGKVDILTATKYCEIPDYLETGDILVTSQKGHTAIVLTDGEKVMGKPYKVAHCVACHLRAGGSAKDAHIAYMHPGDIVSLKGWSATGWGYVVTPDWKIGYISPKFLEPVYKVKTTAKCWIRNGAGTHNSGLVVIPKGTTLAYKGGFDEVTGTTWYNLSYGGFSGFTSGKCLKAF